MKDNYRVKVLLKIIQRIYYKNPSIQEVIDALMIKVCADEGVSPKQVFFILLFFAVHFIIMTILEKSLNKSVEDIEKSFWKF